MEDAFILSWRPQNFLTVGLMILAWVVVYVLVAQGVRRFRSGDAS